MQTRNLTIVVSCGLTKVAQYGHWDGEPEGQGSTALESLRATNLKAFQVKVDLCRFASDEEIRAAYAPYKHRDWATPQQHKAFRESKYAHMGSGVGARILQLIKKSRRGLLLIDSSAFAANSLSCAWTYVIDLDQRTFEVYSGGNEKPLAATERFAPLGGPERIVEGSSYYPVKHLVSFNLDKLPKFFEFTKVISGASLQQARE